ncbi:MAG: hypothetical protein QIT35_gp61 [Methanophagales virus PBV299]|uniref:Uncharacterized protein n=1 Tax=Methanophagales virus PBV299 TaxID=2987730 RepID=A0ABY6GN61_9CAUD|nr:MAG: hypothetical protein QIT35_gp61 [Methanophagales virus PBV299]UYL64857.1 MAG: hypothetical protein OFDIEDLO_00061 [Methanophagales virus PBV299]
MSLSEEIKTALEEIQTDVKAFAEENNYYLISWDTEPDLIPKFPALAFFFEASLNEGAGLSAVYEFTVDTTLIIYHLKPISEFEYPIADISIAVEYFSQRGYDVSLRLEDTTSGTSLLTRAEVTLRKSVYVNKE